MHTRQSSPTALTPNYHAKKHSFSWRGNKFPFYKYAGATGKAECAGAAPAIEGIGGGARLGRIVTEGGPPFT